MQDIWRDNLRLRNEGCRRKNKRSSFDPAMLIWVPRKRHNTRWPITPPRGDTGFIAKLQPLIKFELHPSQIEEATCFEQENVTKQNSVKVMHAQHTGAQQNSVPRSPRVPEPEEPAQQLKREKPGHRRRTLRPSLSTISETTDEAFVFSALTPTSNRFIHASPTKRFQAAADKSKTPTKVAESPMKDFTLDATPKTGDIKTLHQSGHVHAPTNTDSTPGRASVFGDAGCSCAPRTLEAESTASDAPVLNDREHQDSPSRMTLDSFHTVAGSSCYVTALPFFDQPIPDVQVEPEHESRRRVSLDNARRSDRTFNHKLTTRVHKYMAGASVGKQRRHSDVGAMYEHKASKRRHTLDVDAGMNPDIFGQLKSSVNVEIPRKPVRDPDEPMETMQEQASSISSVSLEEAPVQLEENSAQDEDLILSEDEENVEGDSDMAYLQNFVQRSKTSKGEKRDDVASAPILIKSFSKKRRSGSLNSATSEAGSPMAKIATAATTTTTAGLRVPLGEKDANKSPSPSKKRKLKVVENEMAPIKKKNGRLVAPDLDDLEPAATKRKKRRKGMESDTDDIFNPEMEFNQNLTQRSTAGGAGARRSNRIATTHKAEPSPIKVRLPGGVFVDNGDMPTVSTVGITNAVLQRKADQDLAAKTRANTRKNRGGAMPVQMALASMAERCGDGDADETATITTTSVEPKAGHPGGVKTVRWDETLARVQGEETVANTAAIELQECKVEVEQVEPEEQEEEDEEEDTQLPSPPQLHVVSLPALNPDRPGNPVASQIATENDEKEATHAKKLAPVRRSSRAATASRLPKRGGGVTPAAALPASTPRRSSLPAPSRVSKSNGRGGAAALGAAEARARLGMAGPGTPAPRRGGRRGGRRV